MQETVKLKRFICKELTEKILIEIMVKFFYDHWKNRTNTGLNVTLIYDRLNHWYIVAIDYKVRGNSWFSANHLIISTIRNKVLGKIAISDDLKLLSFMADKDTKTLEKVLKMPVKVIKNNFTNKLINIKTEFNSVLRSSPVCLKERVKL